jgi:hypothetical protein
VAYSQAYQRQRQKDESQDLKIMRLQEKVLDLEAEIERLRERLEEGGA